MKTRPVVSYQGEPGAFSEEAAMKYFHRRCKLTPRETFHELFADVTSGRSDRAIVPIENSVYGSIHQNFDLLRTHRVFIVGETTLRINLHLLAMHGVKRRHIQHIYSHPQAIGQCERFLHSLNDVSIHPFYDTAGAAKMLLQTRRSDAAAVASRRAASYYGLDMIRTNIEDNHRNYTRFLIIARKSEKPARNAKTSIVFSTKNIPGALFKSLAVFALRNINLLKIESRPVIGKPFEYLFYVDFEGNAEDPMCQKALDHLQELTASFRNLGSYQAVAGIGRRKGAERS